MLFPIQYNLGYIADFLRIKNDQQVVCTIYVVSDGFIGKIISIVMRIFSKGVIKCYVPEHDSDVIRYVSKRDLEKFIEQSFPNLKKNVQIDCIQRWQNKNKIPDLFHLINILNRALRISKTINSSEDKRKINPGIPLSYEQILEKSQMMFEDHRYKNEILNKIKQQLDSRHYTNYIKKGEPPSFSSCISWDYSRSSHEKSVKIFWAARYFLNALPGVDVTPYVGLEPC